MNATPAVLWSTKLQGWPKRCFGCHVQQDAAVWALFWNERSAAATDFSLHTPNPILCCPDQLTKPLYSSGTERCYQRVQLHHSKALIHVTRKFKQTYSNKVVSILSVRLLSNTLTACYSYTLLRLSENNTAVSTTIIQFTSAISTNLSHLWLLESRQTMSSDLSDVPRVTKNVAPEKKWLKCSNTEVRKEHSSIKKDNLFLLTAPNTLNWVN